MAAHTQYIRTHGTFDQSTTTCACKGLNNNLWWYLGYAGPRPKISISEHIWNHHMEQVQTRGTPCSSSPKFPNPLVFTLPKHTSICHKTKPDRTWHKISKHSQGTFRSACWWWLKCGFTNTYNNTHHKPLEQGQIFKQQTNNWNTKAATVLGSPTIGAYTKTTICSCAR